MEHETCFKTGRSTNGKLYACAEPKGHVGKHYGRDGRLTVPLAMLKPAPAEEQARADKVRDELSRLFG